MLLSLGQEDEAIRAFEACLQLDPLYLDAYERISRVHFGRDEHERELSIWNRALQFVPESARLHYEQATVLVRLERYLEALDACNRAIQLDGTYAIAFAEKGKVLTHLGEYEQALHALDQAIDLAPDFASPYTYKAEVFANVRRYKEALSAYDQLIRLDPDHYFAYWEEANFWGVSGVRKMPWPPTTSSSSADRTSSRATNGSSFSLQNVGATRTGWRPVNAAWSTTRGWPGRTSGRGGC